jgi:gluconokinase
LHIVIFEQTFPSCRQKKVCTIVFMSPKGFLIMGVSGSGKTALGNALACNLGWDFFDADDFHPSANIAKMAAGIPLDDSDRAPWLVALHHLLSSTLKVDHHPVLACSALKENYRAQLLAGNDGIAIIHLNGSYDLIWSRMSAREGHYMKPEMLQSQFDALQEPQNALILDASMNLEDMLDRIMKIYFA